MKNRSYFGALDFSRTPGLFSGVPMNSTPAVSRAALIAINVLKLCACGKPIEASTLRIDDKLTPEASDKSSPDHLSMALAARICSAVIDIYWFLYDTINVIFKVLNYMNTNPLKKLNNLLLYIDGAYAPNTLRAYRADMLEFIGFCVHKQCQALPASPNTVAAFLVSTLDQGIKTTTIKRKVSSISAVHRLLGMSDPTKAAEVKLAMRKIQRQLGTRCKQAYPITRVILDKLLAICEDDLRGVRNRTLLLLACDSMRRRSELVSLRVEDLLWPSHDTLSILLRKSKTDQTGTGHWVHLTQETSKALENWLNDAGITKGFLLRGIDSKGQLTDSLCESRISRIFKRLGLLAGLDESIVRSISGHSMRVGGAQDLLTLGVSLPQIMVKGGWAKTDTVMRYIERVHRPSLEIPSSRRFPENPAQINHRDTNTIR